MCCAPHSCDYTMHFVSGCVEEIYSFSPQQANSLNSFSLLILFLLSEVHILVACSYFSIASCSYREFFQAFSLKNVKCRLTEEHSVHVSRWIWFTSEWNISGHTVPAPRGTEMGIVDHFMPEKYLNRGSNLCQQLSIFIRAFDLDISGFRLSLQQTWARFDPSSHIFSTSAPEHTVKASFFKC